jgi:hypothetical protein
VVVKGSYEKEASHKGCDHLYA